MLSKGFKDQIYNIFHQLDEENVQIALFSATMSQELIEMSKKLLRNPEKNFGKIRSTNFRRYYASICFIGK